MERLDDCRHGVIERTCTKCSQYTPEQARAHDDLMKANKAYGKPEHTPTPIDTDALMTCLLGIGYLPERAAFIVRAVNCHEELLSIARQVAVSGRHIDSPKCFHCKAAQAIAKAEGAK